MTDLEYGLEGVRLCASAVALTGAWAALSSAIMADWRQELYEIRNDLWDAMRAEGALGHPAYQELRDGINGAIRLAPAIGLLHVVADLAVVWRATRGRTDTGAAAPGLPSLSRGAAEAIRRASDRVSDALLRRIFLETFPGCLLGWPCYIVWNMGRRIRPVTPRSRRVPGGGVPDQKWVAGVAERFEHQVASSERRNKQAAGV